MSEQLKPTNTINQNLREIMENFSFYSGIAITFSILLLSISMSNPMKGVFYVGWVLISTITRLGILMMTSDGSIISDKCKKGGLPGDLSKYDGGRNSIYTLCFTFFYVCFPMFITNNVNWYLLWLILSCITFDCIIKFTSGCVTSSISIIGEIVSGSMYGLLVSGIMYYLGLSRFLFANNSGSNKEICSMPKKQTFRCSLYKNGEIISSVKA
jgi:hypothetical protein